MAGTIATAYIQIEPSTKGMSAKLNGEMASAGESGGNSFSSGFGSAVGTVGKIALGAVAAGAAAVGKVVKDSVSAFGEYEQLVGGVETLFDNTENINNMRQILLDMGVAGSAVEERIKHIEDPVQTVLKNASEAYKTAGLSANEYMETVTGMAAALNQSTGDYAVSADMADMAIRDMSDNANKMGSSMESIQHAYSGFAKANYTMLDNLKLGYGGTKEEMQRLLEDATELSGVEYDIHEYADIVDAIHVIQTDLGITGTTAKEAATTIQGSAATMSAAWTNLITGMGTDGADLDGLIASFVESVTTFAGNVIPVIETALQGASTLLAEIAPVIAQELPALIMSVLPELLDAGMEVIRALCDGILAALPDLLPMALDIVAQMGNFIIENLPMLIEAGIQIILQLCTAIASALPELIPTLVDLMLMIIDTLINNADLLIDAAIAIILGLSEGLITAMPMLIEKIPEIVMKLVAAFISNAPKLITAALKLVISLADGIVQSWSVLINKIPQLMNQVSEKFKSFIANWKTIGKNLVDGIWDGIKDSWSSLTSNLGGLVDDLIGLVKNMLGIKSPSRVMANEVGQFLPSGIALGIQNGMGVLYDTIDEMTSDIVVNSVNASAQVESNIAGAKYNPGKLAENGSDISSLLNLMAQYLPIIAQGNNVNISLEGDAGRLFRVMQSEQRRNTELVGI